MSDEFSELKQRVIAKYNGECMICRQPASRIHNRTGGNLSDANDNDLSPMCETCYQIVNSPWRVA